MRSATPTMRQPVLAKNDDALLTTQPSLNTNHDSLANSTPKNAAPVEQHANNATDSNKNNSSGMETAAGDTGDSLVLDGAPPSSRYPMSNVVLMGQFNYDVGPVLVKLWAKIWWKYFKHIVAAGPFSVETIDELNAAGIQVRKGASDRGYVSPTENLMETLLDYYNRTENKDDASRMDKIDGVLYLHDDALTNITRLFFEGDKTAPVNTIIRTPYPRIPESNATQNHIEYSIYVEHHRWRWSNGTEESRISPDFYFETPTSNRVNSWVMLKNKLSPPWWDHWNDCLPQQVRMLSQYDETWWELFSDYSRRPALSENETDIPSNRSRGPNLTSEVISRNSYRFSFPGFHQSDFLYMPLKYTKLFEQAARPQLRNEVFLECAIPTIVQWVIQAAKKKSMVPNERPQNEPNLDDVVDTPKLNDVPLCTSWGPPNNTTRGTDSMLMNCIRSSSDWGMFHPLKLGRGGAAMYEIWLDHIQRPFTNATFSLLATAIDAQNSTKATTNTTDSPIQRY